jgi:plastocyanin
MRHTGTLPTQKLALAFAALWFARCGGTKPPQKAATEPARPVEYFHVDSATAGTLSGRILFRGAKPAREVISMESEEGCQQAHAGHPVYDESIVVGKRGGLSNAFVYIQSGLEGKSFEPVKEAVGLDQHGCMFIPRVIGIRAGQTLDVKNSDAVSHNIHPMPKSNREWNEQQSPQSPDVEHRFPRPEIMIPVKCNVHSWMRAYIGVMEHPYFAVTRADGSFEMTNVPPGDYTVAAWHEKLGDQTKQIHLAASEHGAVEFTFQ